MNKKNILIPIGICLICLGTILTIVTINFKKEKKRNSNYSKDSIIIRYYPSYNIATAEAINSIKPFVDEVRIELKGEEKAKVLEFVSNVKQTDFNFDECDCVYMVDQYEIIVNDKDKYSMGNEFGKKDDITFEIPKEIDEYISNIISDYVKKNIYKSITANKITIEIDGEKIELEDQNDIDNILEYKYFEVHEKEDYKKYDGGPRGIIELDDTKIYLYGNINYISNGNNSTYAIFNNSKGDDLITTAKRILNNNNMNIKEKLKTNTIEIEYKNNKYSIDDEEKIEEIYNEITDFTYSRYNYLEGMSEDTSFTSDDIKVIINDCRFYIPGNSSWGSRFFVDEDGSLYDVGELINSSFEKYVKEAINYDE